MCISPFSGGKMTKNLPKARNSKVEHQPKLSLKMLWSEWLYIVHTLASLEVTQSKINSRKKSIIFSSFKIVFMMWPDKTQFILNLYCTGNFKFFPGRTHQNLACGIHSLTFSQNLKDVKLFYQNEFPPTTPSYRYFNFFLYLLSLDICNIY